MVMSIRRAALLAAFRQSDGVHPYRDGAGCWTDRDSDFVKFREENRGRLSHLRGGRSFDNAMIMQINDYIFVEFSGTGNAMYAYRIGEAPFNPESGSLEINVHLKAGGAASCDYRMLLGLMDTATFASPAGC